MCVLLFKAANLHLAAPFKRSHNWSPPLLWVLPSCALFLRPLFPKRRARSLANIFWFLCFGSSPPPSSSLLTRLPIEQKGAFDSFYLWLGYVASGTPSAAVAACHQSKSAQKSKCHLCVCVTLFFSLSRSLCLSLCLLSFVLWSLGKNCFQSSFDIARRTPSANLQLGSSNRQRFISLKL